MLCFLGLLLFPALIHDPLCVFWEPYVNIPISESMSFRYTITELHKSKTVSFCDLHTCDVFTNLETTCHFQL